MRKGKKMIKDSLDTLMTDTRYKCNECGSANWEYLHQGDWSNCDCGDNCLRVCTIDYCEGVAE